LISHKDFNPFYKQEVGSYKKKSLVLSKEILTKSFEEKISQNPNSYFADYQLDSNHKLTVRMNEKIEPTPTVSEITNPMLAESNNELCNTKKYQYVLGCFANQTNATNFYNKLKSAGLDVNKTSAGSLIRITVGATNELASLQEEISKANSLGYQGWILKN
jgi:cell division protein FtsN